MSELPGNWTVANIKELLEFKYGKGLTQESRNSSGSVNVYGSNGVVGKHDLALTSGATIIIGRKGSVGEVNFSPVGCWAIDTTYYIDEFLCNISPQYWTLYLSATLKSVQNEKSSAIPGISREDIYRIEVPVPPLNEQHRIVVKLEKLLAKCEACKQRLDKIPDIIKRFRQSILAAACSGRLTADWREQNLDVEPASELLRRIYVERIKRYEEDCIKAKQEGRRKPYTPKAFEVVNDDSFDIPLTWTLAYPEDVASLEEYSIGIGPFGSNLKVSDYTNEGVPLIFVRHIRSGNFLGLEPKYISLEKAEELHSHSVKALDLLVTKMGEPPGNCEIYPQDRPCGVITADCLKFRIWEKDLVREYFKNCINSFVIKDQLGLITKGVAQQKISVERFKSLLFPVPPLAEQKEIIRRIEKLFKLADQIEQRYQKARAYVDKLPQSILAKAFRGKLVPQDPNDEPASVLLERIRAERSKEGKGERAKGKGRGGRGRQTKQQTAPAR